jgi:murein L,D-transpeptidase YafK
VAFLLFYPVPVPPSTEMKDARDAISKARKNMADVYANDLYTEAVSIYDSAMASWSLENKNFIYKRNYNRIVTLAGLSEKKAIQASESSLNNALNISISLEPKLSELNDLLTKINKIFPTYPLTPEVRNKISMGKMLLMESETAFKDGDYYQADKKIAEAKDLLEYSYEFADSQLRSYFKSFPQWKIWVDSTIALSEQNHDYSIIVDKYSHKFFVYLDGKRITEFTAELGKNWVGDKSRRGDKATPEGMYKIIKKLEGDSTAYYKALMLNYPNDEDTLRFRKAVQNGGTSSVARLGDKIEIHGNGGRGADWTEGCIALKDREMDSIFKYVREDTPVTIVGSLYSLKNILKR